MADPRTILVLAPHTDDGELGCGGTLARHARMGDSVHYAAFSTCAQSLPAGLPSDTLAVEVARATARLGIPAAHLHILDFDVRHFAARRQDILEEMVRLRAAVKPDLVYLPSSDDHHQDHQVIAAEGLRAFKKSTIFGYELPWNNARFDARAFVSLSQAHLDAKVAALADYASQAGRSYMGADFTRSLARVRGEMAGETFAEAFEVIRLYVR